MVEGVNNMKKANSAPTMKDVASEADVALSTVSKAVNGLISTPNWNKNMSPCSRTTK